MLSISTRVQNADWRVDQDGFLHVNARILKSGVFRYALEDVPEELRGSVEGKTAVMEEIPEDELDDIALATLEGKPVILPPDTGDELHTWQTSENALRDGLTVGTVAGKPVRDASGVLCHLVITNAEGIARVQNGRNREISAAYHSQLEPAGENGQGTHGADFVQRALRFNHVLLCRQGQGRCGPDVRILNTVRKGDATMPVMVKIGNSAEFGFSTEQDAACARALVQNACNAMEEDSKRFKAEAEQKNADLVAAQGEVKTEQGKTAQLLAKLKELEAMIASLGSEEHQNAVATERAGYAADEQAVTRDVPEKDKLTAAVGNCKSLAERKRTVTVHVLNASKIDASKYSEAEINAAFTVLAAGAKSARPTMGVPQPPRGETRTQNAADRGGKKHPYDR